jgi:hypothetical protein
MNVVVVKVVGVVMNSVVLVGAWMSTDWDGTGDDWDGSSSGGGCDF